MTPAEHRREAEKALSASEWQRQRWGEFSPGPDADAAFDACMWEMRRAEVHALLALSAPPPAPRPAGAPVPAPKPGSWAKAGR